MQKFLIAQFETFLHYKNIIYSQIILIGKKDIQLLERDI